MSENYFKEITSGQPSEVELTLRPGNFGEFLGQQKVKERLLLMVEAALRRGEALGHVLLCGPPGLGKTTLSNILASAMGSQIHTISGPQIEKAGDLAGVLTSLQEKDILFIDEIHRLHARIEEYLYPSMEDFCLDIMIDQGPAAKTVRIDLPPFTLVGATTRAGMLTAPLRSRFGVANRLDYYEAAELAHIVHRSAAILAIGIDEPGAMEIASRSRGTPRVANALLRWVRDYAEVRGSGRIDSETATAALAMIEIDEDGLDEMDKRILESVIYKFNGGPVGIGTIAISVGEEQGTLEDVYEPYLIMQGFLKRTPRGRVAMPSAYAKFGLSAPTQRDDQGELFEEQQP